MRREIVALLLACGASPLVACSAIWGFQDVSLESADAGADSGSDTGVVGPDGAVEGGVADSSADAGPQALAMGLNGPGPLAIDSTYVYYAVVTTNQIWRMAKDGSGLMQVADGSFVLAPSAIATDGTSFYFTDQIASSANVYGCPVAGCGTANDVAYTTANNPTGVAVANGTVFWTANGNGFSGGAVASATTSAPGATTALFTATDNSSPVDVAIDGTTVYFTDDTNGSLRRMQTDGTGLVDLTISNEPSSSLGLAIGQDAVFFTTAVSGGGPGAVWSVTKADGTINPSFATDQASCLSITTDTTNVYWVNAGDSSSATGSIVYCPQSGCPASGAIALASAQPSPYGIAVDDSYVYWTNFGVGNSSTAGSVMRIAKP